MTAENISSNSPMAPKSHGLFGNPADIPHYSLRLQSRWLCAPEVSLGLAFFKKEPTFLLRLPKNCKIRLRFGSKKNEM